MGPACETAYLSGSQEDSFRFLNGFAGTFAAIIVNTEHPSSGPPATHTELNKVQNKGAVTQPRDFGYARQVWSDGE